MNAFLQQIEEVIRAVSFRSATSYAWFGQPLPALDAKTKRALTPEAARGYLLYSLQQQLYRDFYVQGGVIRPEPEALLPAVMIGLTPFVQALSAANSGGGCYEDGWQVQAVEDGTYVVRKDELTIWAPAGDCRNAKGTTLGRGVEVQLRFPKELLNMSPGFYLVLGNQRLPDSEGATIVRFYWNLSAESAVPFVEQTTRLLNQAQMAFRLKVLRDPALYRRCDAAVVYVLKRDYAAVAELLARVYREVAPALKKAIPALTKPLAPGLGLAENAGYGESFGEHRCRLLAEALTQAYELGRTTLQERLETIQERFVAAGLRLEVPFLGPGASDVYRFEREHEHRG